MPCTFPHLITPPLTSSPLPLSLHLKHHDADIINSCHGILCISDFPNFLALYNPTNRTFQNILLEDPGQFRESHWVDFGFGFDGVSKDYKIVRVDQFNSLFPNHGGCTPKEVKVFSLKAMSWKIVDNFPHFLSHPKSHGKFLCNSLHWIATTNNLVVFSFNTLLLRGHKDDTPLYDYVIVKYDLHLEKFTHLDLPDYENLTEDVEMGSCCLSLGVLEECLFVQVEHGPRFKRRLDIWVMKEYGVKESWTKLLSFSFQEARGELLPVRTLALSKWGGEALMQQGTDYFWFDLRSAGTRETVVEGCLPNQFMLVGGHRHVFGAVVYVGSLVRLACSDGGVKIEQGTDDGKKEGDSESFKVKKKKSEKEKKRGVLLSAGFKLEMRRNVNAEADM